MDENIWESNFENLNYLKEAVNLLKEEDNPKEQQFGLFSYKTRIHFKKRSQKISYEQTLFPNMNPNIIGGVFSIFSCKPRYRVTLNPGDIIFCFPQAHQFFKNKATPRRLTLIFNILKKIEIKDALKIKLLKFKSVSNKHSINVKGQDISQYGDITARFTNGRWEYAGKEKGTHSSSKKTLEKQYSEYLINQNQNPPRRLGRKMKTKFNIRNETWEYDILFKWGLIGGSHDSIPIKYRSFYFGSEGLPFDDFWSIITKYCKVQTKNPRHVKQKALNKKGQEILQEIKTRLHIENGI